MRKVIGSFTAGSAATKALELGFVPDKLTLINLSAAATEIWKFTWYRTLGDAKGTKEYMALLGTSVLTTPAYMSSGGFVAALAPEVTASDTSNASTDGSVVSLSGAQGVTITASGFMANTNVILYEAELFA